ncbi:MAG TPA: hypothetical protein PLX69_08870 [Leptospiraceae bacterium]|nr:hypothetical protein [Leptospiraceae bacterium]HRG74656.1 hypothetical protein [Leptospiraceae bacterium]
MLCASSSYRMVKGSYYSCHIEQQYREMSIILRTIVVLPDRFLTAQAWTMLVRNDRVPLIVSEWKN